MPNHSHDIWANPYQSGGENPIERGNGRQQLKFSNLVLPVGGSQAHNNIPPTISVIYWRRVV